MSNKIQQKEYCIYARKSMESEERQALSIDSQISEMNNIAERDNLLVVDTKFESHSAKDSGQREVFNELIQDLKSGKFNSIITWNTDRLSRNAGDLGQIVDLMDRGNLLEIKTFNQTFTNTPNDKFLLMILGSQAKLENDNKGVNVKRGMRARVKAGLWPSVAPTGYLDSKIKGNECKKMLDPILAPVVKKMFEKVAYDGYTNRQLFFWLKEESIRTRAGKIMNFGTIHEILNRTFYYGEFEYPKKSGDWYKGVHKPIITKELFDQTQKVLSLHSKNRSYKRRGKEPFTFARFMNCGVCGSGIIADEHFKRPNNGKIHRYVYYHCSDAKTHNCSDKSNYLEEKVLIKQIINLIGTLDSKYLTQKEKHSEMIERIYRYDSFMTNEPILERDQKKRDSDLRKYIQVLFRDGTPEERLTIVKNLKRKLTMKDRKISLNENL